MSNDRIPSQSNLGASEVAAVLGMSPWATPFDIWARKTGRMGEQEETRVMRLGNLLEPVVLTLAEDELGPLDRQPQTLLIPNSPIVCHLDAKVASSGIPVEAKTAGVECPIVGNWGEDGTDDIPDYYWVQLAMYVKASQKDLGYLAAYLGGRGFRMYVCPARHELADQIVNDVGEWWDRHIIGDRQPENSAPSEETMRRMKRQPVTVDLAAEAIQLADDYAKVRQHRLDAERQEKAIQATLAGMMGDAMAGKLPDGRVLGWTEFLVGSLDRERLKAERPEVVEQYTSKKPQRRWFGPKNQK